MGIDPELDEDALQSHLAFDEYLKLKTQPVRKRKSVVDAIFNIDTSSYSKNKRSDSISESSTKEEDLTQTKDHAYACTQDNQYQSSVLKDENAVNTCVQSKGLQPRRSLFELQKVELKKSMQDMENMENDSK